MDEKTKGGHFDPLVYLGLNNQNNLMFACFKTQCFYFLYFNSITLTLLHMRHWEKSLPQPIPRKINDMYKNKPTYNNMACI